MPTDQKRSQLLRATAERWDDYRDHVLYVTAFATGEHELRLPLPQLGRNLAGGREVASSAFVRIRVRSE